MDAIVKALAQSSPGILAGVAVLAVLAVLARALRNPTRTGGAREWPVTASAPLSEIEQVLYWRLCEAFPGHVILAQVALSQIIRVERPPNLAVFNRFSQLVADFVICTKAFGVTAVVELDDKSHGRADRADADARKAAVLGAAGHPLVRVPVSRMPTVTELRTLVGAAGVRAEPTISF
jgi:hypothetical protein